ncbi:WAT1-related protein At5g64700-like [Phalaenopsis equestris]|uniref:WAT1-related protein At5g64700-like n=1 Tax=Phalaenopsis equestris TaxID=78828 RepID=UPI0009E41A10|nr:WAT1-related protein At5g64700-like [Phalaenopsis equestris]
MKGLGYGVLNILMKIAMQQGLSHHVLVAYRHLLATVISAPVAYVLERKQRPPLSLLILVKIFLLALVGITIQQNIFFAGLGYTSPTVAGALSSAIPAFTFILAVLMRNGRLLLCFFPCRMEKVRIRTAKGRTKILGTLVCVSGALVFTFWKGHLLKGFVKRPLIVIHGSHFRNGKEAVNEDWVKGSLVILTGQIIFCTWIVFQVKNQIICSPNYFCSFMRSYASSTFGVVFEAYPARLSLNALMCCFAFLQSLVEALIFERNKSCWQLGWNMQLAAVIYSGVVISFLAYNLQVYCTSEKGPFFTAIFYPLMLVIAGILSAILYAERLHLGSLIGAIIIIIGLYSVLWGKTEDGIDEGKKKEKNYAEKGIQTTTQNLTSPNRANHV